MAYFRALLIRIHTLIGLVGGLFFALLGLTGAALAFRPAIETALYWPAAGAGNGWEQAAGAVLAFAPQKKTREVNFRDGRAWEFVIHNRDGSEPESVYVDPASGKIMQSRVHSDSMLHGIYHLHADLMLGGFGLQIVSRLALLFVLHAIAGLLIWRMQSYPFHWHAMLGVTGGVIAALLAYSGWRMLTARVPSVIPIVTLRGVENRVPLEQLVETARKRRPQGTLRSIYFPQAPAQPLQFWFGERPSDGIVYMDPYGAILPVMMAAENNVAADWHRGPAGGTFVRLLRLFAGIAVVLSFATGLWRKLRKEKPR